MQPFDNSQNLCQNCAKNYTFDLIIEVLSQNFTEVACGSWLAVVLGVQSTDSGGSLPPPTADGFSPITTYNTKAESLLIN